MQFTDIDKFGRYARIADSEGKCDRTLAEFRTLRDIRTI